MIVPLALTLAAVALVPLLVGGLVVFALARRMGRGQYGVRPQASAPAAFGMVVCLG